MNLERELLRIAGWPLHRLLLRLSGGRIGTAQASSSGMGTLSLITTGRRSGVRRERPLYFMPDGDRFVVVASNVGDARDPAWWLNLQAAPEAEIRTPSGLVAVRAYEAVGDERERLWPELVRRHPTYARYERRTQRRIPVVVLVP
jgi:deazaflavin-dependent oxidoreductase (nitroreductase family)